MDTMSTSLKMEKLLLLVRFMNHQKLVQHMFTEMMEVVGT